MSIKDPATLRLRPQWSRQLLLYWALAHGTALAIASVLPLPWLVRLTLLALIGCYGGYSFATHWWRRLPWSILEANSRADGWELVLSTGEPVQARLLASSFIGQHIMVLNFALIGRGPLSLALPLAADSLDANLMRRLRVTLRAAASPKNTL